jgi:hypothetical protein
MRYMATEHEVRQALHRFQYDMAELRIHWTSGQPGQDQAKAYLERARAFILEVDDLILAETALWIAEFRDVLENIDAAIRERRAKSNGAAEETIAALETGGAGKRSQTSSDRRAAASKDATVGSSSPPAIQ